MPFTSETGALWGHANTARDPRAAKKARKAALAAQDMERIKTRQHDVTVIRDFGSLKPSERTPNQKRRLDAARKRMNQWRRDQTERKARWHQAQTEREQGIALATQEDPSND